MKRSVVVSFNWETTESLHTSWSGDGCGMKAVSWADKRSFIWEDFPELEGWTHFCHLNPEAREELVDQRMEALLGTKVNEQSQEA